MAFTWCRGVVDSHVHFVDPGALEREDFLTGSQRQLSSFRTA